MGRRRGDLGQWRSRERAQGAPQGMGLQGEGQGTEDERREERTSAPDRTVATSSAGHRLQAHRLIRIFCSSNGSARRRGREVGWALVPYEVVGE